MSNSSGGGRGADVTSLSGVALLSLYLFFDAFQSQWQSGLFRKEKVSQLEMMRGVNAAASILSIVSLVRVTHPRALDHLSVCSLVSPNADATDAYILAGECWRAKTSNCVHHSQPGVPHSRWWTSRHGNNGAALHLLYHLKFRTCYFLNGTYSMQQ